ncbi:hypothetical protein H8R29_11675 [Priestia megaterium]|uniref:Uncharacterized protein n=1 Tax=Priestia megaterium (strain ATCC 14581 / DSM 32 / CCUG 1817 / JCM 2506 / NBRC 15308 / NCIMB 9376 / NCTC 10342 / NRRL B-14308 / VKM B-512 / Ford 19) TaxID=1348623 RepID=A0A0B6AU48_PRIM2|nr:hypothetical protein [Priestia megaterium]AJI24228.1 hypothetical protein BG04_4623 [Priestia megaterium NBRC 15308 = ATCC 14581]KFM97944.1 hypothetical protein DJ91_646 [Priestia megaterium]KGJ73908.1 hypothetical protein BMT_05880 [Priestia megaterium NBRC 15308 = ATCC 14581]MDR4231373.1 hypothetical protein [Priestia megaterium]MED3807640.1 hypothetical protein [Priestia megaterium]
MNFSWRLESQLQQSMGMTLEVATDNALFEGVLKNFENGLIKLEETVIGYERENRSVSIALSSVNFIKVQF